MSQRAVVQPIISPVAVPFVTAAMLSVASSKHAPGLALVELAGLAGHGILDCSMDYEQNSVRTDLLNGCILVLPLAVFRASSRAEVAMVRETIPISAAMPVEGGLLPLNRKSVFPSTLTE